MTEGTNKNLDPKGDKISNGESSSAEGKGVDWSRHIYTLRAQDVHEKSKDVANSGISSKEESETMKAAFKTDEPSTSWAHLPNGELDLSLADLDPKAPETEEEVIYWQRRGSVLTSWRKEWGPKYQMHAPIALNKKDISLVSIKQYNEICLGDHDIPVGHPMHFNELDEYYRKLVNEAKEEFEGNLTGIKVLSKFDEYGKNLSTTSDLFKAIRKLSEIYKSYSLIDKNDRMKRLGITRQIINIIGAYRYAQNSDTVSKWQEMQELLKVIERQIEEPLKVTKKSPEGKID